MREQMLNTKQNKGIAIRRINEVVARGDKVVTGVEMSAAWHRAKDQTVAKLLSGEYGDEVKFPDPHQSFCATRDKPADHNNIVDEVGKDDDIIYIVASELN